MSIAGEGKPTLLAGVIRAAHEDKGHSFAGALLILEPAR